MKKSTPEATLRGSKGHSAGIIVCLQDELRFGCCRTRGEVRQHIGEHQRRPLEGL